MQGNFQEIDIRGLLQSLETGQKTGELHIATDPLPGESEPRSWLLYFVNGQIAYAHERTARPPSRLGDYLYPYRVESGENSDGAGLPEYTDLWRALTDREVTPGGARGILEAMIRETLFDLFALRRGAFVFEGGIALAPLLLTLPLSPLLPEIARQVQRWQTFHPRIRRADQYIHLTGNHELRSVLPEKAYRILSGLARRRTTLRELSRYLRRDVATVARSLHPYAERGWLSFPGPGGGAVAGGGGEASPPPRSVSIGRGEGPGKKIHRWLEAVGFPCTEFGGSAEALSPLFENEPDAIFCEIDLPKLDGYEFCHLLRRSSCFRATPIVLLGRAGETLDRRRAKLVGVTDYLGEPFDEGEFFETLAIHLRTPPPRRDLPEKFAADSGFFASSGKDRGSSHQDRRNFGQEENRSL